MKKDLAKQSQRQRKVHRVRARIVGTAARPRVSVLRTLRHLSAQFVDDATGKTVMSVSDKELDTKGKQPLEKAAELGKLAGKKASELGIKEVVFDRRWYKYHGRVKAFADALRESGIQF